MSVNIRVDIFDLGINKYQSWYFWLWSHHLVLLRSRHIVLWSLETLIGQQRFYGTRLITRKKKILSPFKHPTWGKLNIASFVLNY
jgi:hypothetical protein